MRLTDIVRISGPAPVYYAAVTTVRETGDGLYAVWREADGKVRCGLVGAEPEVLEAPTDLMDAHQWPAVALTAGGVPVVAVPDGPANRTWLRVGRDAPVYLPSCWDICSSGERLVAGCMVAGEGGEDAVELRLDGRPLALRKLVNARFGEPDWADEPGNEFAKRHLIDEDLLLWVERTTFRHGGGDWRRICGDLYGAFVGSNMLEPIRVGHGQRIPVDLQSDRFRLAIGPIEQWSVVGADALQGIIAVPLVRYLHSGGSVNGYPDANTDGVWRLDLLVLDPDEGWALRPHSTYVWGSVSWHNQRPRVVIGDDLRTLYLFFAPTLEVWTSRDLGRTWSVPRALDVPAQPAPQFATQREPNGVYMVYRGSDACMYVGRITED